MFDPAEFIDHQVQKIKTAVGEQKAIAAVSGGVDSAVAYVLARRALGKRCIGLFVDNGLMRKGEPKDVVGTFAALCYPVRTIKCQAEFTHALVGLSDPEEKREAICKMFYAVIFREQAKWLRAPFLVQGTILTDIDETVAGIKRQHNVLAQVGIDTWTDYGYMLIEPLATIHKFQVRRVAKALGLPNKIIKRMPFPGPALACRIIGKVTAFRLKIVRMATAIVEEEFIDWDLFQSMAILHGDYVTGMRGGERQVGYQIEVRAWQSKDAIRAKPFVPSYYRLERLSSALTEIPGVVNAVINFTPKPPSTIEAV